MQETDQLPSFIRSQDALYLVAEQDRIAPLL